jgi:hypothetical protein
MSELLTLFRVTLHQLVLACVGLHRVCRTTWLLSQPRLNASLKNHRQGSKIYYCCMVGVCYESRLSVIAVAMYGQTA